MRKPRLKLHGRSAVYHCTSRIVGGQWLLGGGERQILRNSIYRQAKFCGLIIVTYSILINHFHVTARVPVQGELSDQQILARCEDFYGPEHALVQRLRTSLEQTGQIGSQDRRALLARMGDISVFNKELKQRFTRSYNARHDRFGTLWAERFRSTLIEDTFTALVAVAAYVDLNSVRAGLNEDPAHFRFSGYGEAVAGPGPARQGLLSIWPEGRTWEEVSREYREILLTKAGRPGHSDKVALEPEQIQRLLAEQQPLERGQALRLRNRSFIDAVAIGSRDFVEGIFQEFRSHFGPRRKTGARSLKKLGLPELYALRDLKVNAVGISENQQEGKSEETGKPQD